MAHSAKKEALPEHLRKSLMPFQRQGVAFVIRQNGRALIGDEMGLGKTLQAIAVASIYRNEWPCLVFMPASMRWVWAEELERWLLDLRPGDVKVVRSTQDTDAMHAAKFVLCTFDLVARSQLLQAALSARGFGVCIVDESHYCKSRAAKRTEAVRTLASSIRRCVLLSGTPALNRPAELYPQLAILDPALVG
jgi:SWI/SNF-related matrix-associated actin-dependent regulator 1 of chromatin subfamily A